MINFFMVALTRNSLLFQTNSLLRAFHNFSICAAHFNSAINPFIYAYRIKDVRETVKMMYMKFKSTLFPCLNVKMI